MIVAVQIILGREFRVEGVYKNAATNMYTLGINQRNFITNHAEHPELFGHEFKPDAGTDLAGTLQALINGLANDPMVCEMYDGRVACTTNVTTPSGTVRTIAGLHHADDDLAFALPDCPGFELGTTAQDVYDNPTKPISKLT